MKKRIVSACIMILILLPLTVSCGDTADTEWPFTKEDDSFSYNGFYFYMEQLVKGDEDTQTPKYISFDSEDTVGAQVYSDLFDVEGDPFHLHDPKLGEAFGTWVMLDREASEKNDGYPVIIISTVFNGEDDAVVDRLLSYNMATGKTKVLCENIGDGASAISLYGDKIYYQSFEGEEDFLTGKREGEFFIYSLPKDGGEPAKLPLPVKDEELLLDYAYKDKLYIRVGRKELYRCDLDGKNFERVASIDSTDLKIVENGGHMYYNGGYVYYRVNGRKTAVTNESGEGEETTKYVFDLYRQKLDDVKDFNEKNGEKLLENVSFYKMCEPPACGIYYSGENDRSAMFY